MPLKWLSSLGQAAPTFIKYLLTWIDSITMIVSHWVWGSAGWLVVRTYTLCKFLTMLFLVTIWLLFYDSKWYKVVVLLIFQSDVSYDYYKFHENLLTKNEIKSNFQLWKDTMEIIFQDAPWVWCTFICLQLHSSCVEFFIQCNKSWVGVEWEGIYIHIRVMAPEQIHIMHIYSSENLQPFVKLLFQTILSMFGILNMSKFSLRIGNYFYC